MIYNILITPQQVVDNAFAEGEYLPYGAITEAMIAAAQNKYLKPILGSELIDSINENIYQYLDEEYIIPTLAILTRIEANLEAYPPTNREHARARIFLNALSDYLNENADDYPEYDAANNAKNRCSILSGFVF